MAPRLYRFTPYTCIISAVPAWRLRCAYGRFYMLQALACIYRRARQALACCFSVALVTGCCAFTRTQSMAQYLHGALGHFFAMYFGCR